MSERPFNGKYQELGADEARLLCRNGDSFLSPSRVTMARPVQSSKCSSYKLIDAMHGEIQQQQQQLGAQNRRHQRVHQKEFEHQRTASCSIIHQEAHAMHISQSRAQSASPCLTSASTPNCNKISIHGGIKHVNSPESRPSTHTLTPSTWHGACKPRSQHGRQYQARNKTLLIADRVGSAGQGRSVAGNESKKPKLLRAKSAPLDRVASARSCSSSYSDVKTCSGTVDHWDSFFLDDGNKAEHIKVAIRIRPLNRVEKSRGDAPVLEVHPTDPRQVVIRSKPIRSTTFHNSGRETQMANELFCHRQFSFNYCLNPHTDQGDVSRLCGVIDMLDAVLDGCNAVVFAVSNFAYYFKRGTLA